MPDPKEAFKQYRGIIFSKEDVFRITKLNRFDRQNIIYAYSVIKNYYTNSGLSLREIASSLNVSVNLINKIVKDPVIISGMAGKISSELIDRSNRASLLAKCIGVSTLSKLQQNYELSDEEIDVLLRKIYFLWHEVGTLYSLSERLGIPSSTKVSYLIRFIRDSGIIKNFSSPKRKLSEKHKKNILKTKELYDELLNLSLVGKRLGITRERVRQILEKGNDYGLIEYKPVYIKKFDEVANRFKKEDLEKLLVQYGSIKKLLPHIRNIFDFEIQERHIRNLLKIYSIHQKDLVLQHRKNKCYLEYDEMIQELGYHPTTTVMQNRQKWRALWSRISKIWGCMNNFRNEFGIPIPQKGSPTFKEDMLEGRQARLNELRKIKSEKVKMLLEYVNNNSPVSRKQIKNALNFKSATMENYLKELVDKDELDWMWDGKRYLYFKKP